MLEVLDPGLHSTIQDEGRPHAAPLGVPRGGAADPLALAVLRVLIGCDEPTTVALEMNLVGAAFAVRETCLVGITGADFGATVVEEHRALRPGTARVVQAGTTLTFGEARDGARAYLSLDGGIDCPRVLGSASTCLVGGFGGIDGRPLRAGDKLRPVHRGTDPAGEGRWPGAVSGCQAAGRPQVIRVVAGPHLDRFEPGALDSLAAEEWTVSPRSDRMGIRLTGGSPRGAEAGETASVGMVWGAIQVPAGGEPIVLGPDHQTVGGYPVIACAIGPDRPTVGQVRAGDVLRFEPIDLDEARMLRLTDRAVFRDLELAFRAVGESAG